MGRRKSTDPAEPLDKPMKARFDDQTARNATDRADPRLAIVGKTDLEGPAPFTVAIAQIDPLHDDGEAMAGFAGAQ